MASKSGPKFDISITKDGTVKVHVHGVSGAECIAFTEMIRQIVGIEQSRTLTSEYHGGDVRIQARASVQNRVQTNG